MTTIRADPRKQRFPALSGRLILYARRGQLIVQAWPRKRGRPKSPITREQNEWFTAVNRLAKRCDPGQQKIAIEATKGTGLYPRDLLIALMAGGMVEPVYPDGSVVKAGRYFRKKIMFQGAILGLTAPQAMPANTIVTFLWPLPLVDTAGFWNVAAPTRLTIPAGIDVVELFAGWAAVGGAGTNRNLALIYKNGGLARAINWQSILDPNDAVASGPLIVAEGDFFEAKGLYGAATNAIGNERTFFSLNVLGAT